MNLNNLAFYLCFILFPLFLHSAILPHQGRVLISGTPFDGNATFRFALVDQSGGIVWNHEGGTGLPGTDLAIEVKKGFYQCHLGDTQMTGMATLPEGLFSTYPGLKLRIWFNDGTNGIQQLGKDQSLLVAPYAMNIPKPSASANLVDELAQGISQYATTSGVSSTQLVTQLTELAGKVATGAIDINSLSPEKIQELVRQTVQSSGSGSNGNTISTTASTDLTITNQSTIFVDKSVTDELKMTLPSANGYTGESIKLFPNHEGHIKLTSLKNNEFKYGADYSIIREPVEFFANQGKWHAFG